MRLQKQITFVTTLLLLVTIISGVGGKSASAEQGYEGNSCTQSRGLDIALVMDNSGSIESNDPNDIRIAASKDLINNLHPYDRMSVIQFDQVAKNLQSLTSDRTAITNALDSLVPFGGTDLSEGMGAALLEFEANGGNNHKIMIILSDGESINNSISIEHAKKAHQENIVIYTIGLGSSVNVPLLKQIAAETDGQYYPAVNATYLTSIFDKIRQAAEELRQPKMYSDRTLTQDLQVTGDFVLEENVKLDLNGYDLTVGGDLVLRSCAELRGVSGGIITADMIDQKAGSSINLNNSQIDVNTYKQDGILRVNGDYGGSVVPEIIVKSYNQQVRGYLDLNGHSLYVTNDFFQEGKVDVSGGSIQVKGNVTQEGFFNLQKGNLFIDGNLTINGGPLMDDAFTQNKSLNVGGGLVQVGSAESMKLTSKIGNVVQTNGQLFVNHGSVRIFGDYMIKNGWLTMIKGSMDTLSDEYGEGDGDYVHVYRNFSMESQRNHSQRIYQQLGKPMNDQAHLTDGILQVDGNFRQVGDREFHTYYSDLSQNYMKNYSGFNFVASGRHKVLLTGKGNIDVSSYNFTFNNLELKGTLENYSQSGSIRWNNLTEKDTSANATLDRLSINDIPVTGFNPNVLNYFNHEVPVSTVTSPIKTLKVDAVADDNRNATVEVVGNTIGVDGTALVKILVTANDGITKKVYTVSVRVGTGSGGKVTSIVLNQDELSFIQNSGPTFSPSKATIGYTVYPNNAVNQQVNWSSTNPAVATVNPSGIVTPLSVGETTIIAQTADGGFMDSLTVKVSLPYDLLEGIKNFEDLTSDDERFNKIMSLYDLNKIGIIVPGQFIHSVDFSSTGGLAIGKVKTNISSTPKVAKIEVNINERQLGASTVVANEEFLFTRQGLTTGDFVEVIAYDVIGNELERISTTYPVNYISNSVISSGFYSIKGLLENPIIFDEILSLYTLEQLRFVAN